MGYNTRYSLTADPPNWECPQEYKVDEDRPLEVWNAWVGGGRCKWYEHEEDMRNLSVKFPAYTFRLEGQGETTGDWWVKFFRNGKMQFHKAVLPELREDGEWT